MPLAEVGAEFLFQVIAERAEKAAVIMTTNLLFSEWTQVIPNARLCKALLDRITDRAHILSMVIRFGLFRSSTFPVRNLTPTFTVARRGDSVYLIPAIRPVRNVRVAFPFLREQCPFERAAGRR